MDAKKAKDLDKYYTNDDVASTCYTEFTKFCTKYINNYTVIEPSAGAGAFYNIINEPKLGYDIHPESTDIVELDFLNSDISTDITGECVFLGNPPFGKKGDLAIRFINKCFEYSNIVGFILPAQFKKYSVQSKIDSRAKLVLDIELDEESFNIIGKPYKVRSSFQIWAIGSYDESNLRLLQKPSTSTQYFEMYQFNRTEGTKKYFDYDWDFAVTRQGYYDYTDKIFKKEDLNPKRQYIFFKAHNEKVLDNLLKMDYNVLSKKNAGIPGFGKADVIMMYNSLYP